MFSAKWQPLCWDLRVLFQGLMDIMVTYMARKVVRQLLEMNFEFMC